MNPLLLDAHSTVSLALPLELASVFLDYVLNNNSRFLFVKNSTLEIQEGIHHKILIPGASHFERNLRYLAAHLSESHRFRTLIDNETLFSSRNNHEHGVFYIVDNRLYGEKLQAPLVPAKNIVDTFFKLPVQSFYLKSYEYPHRRVIYAKDSGGMKEFTHKLVITKDFKKENMEDFRNLAPIENFICEGKFLDGIGLALSKKNPINKSHLYTPNFSQTTQVSLLIQITKEVYKHLMRSVLMDDFMLEGEILKENAFVLTLFPFLPEIDKI